MFILKKLYGYLEKIIGLIAIVGTIVSSTVCPIWFPVCIPLYGYLFFAFLVSIGLSVHSAFFVSVVVGIFLLYVSLKLMYRLSFKVVKWWKSRV